MIDNAVSELEKNLPKLRKVSYSSIDSLMRRIMRKYDVTAKELHFSFKDKHHKTPDEWIKEKNSLKEMKTFDEFYETCMLLMFKNEI